MTWKVLGAFLPKIILKYLCFPNLHGNVVRSLELSAMAPDETHWLGQA